MAIQRYLVDCVPRMLVPMWLSVDRMADIRGNRDASVVWQDTQTAEIPSPTWAFSDAAREGGAQALLYSSRSRPDISHVVAFEPDCLSLAGNPVPFHPERPGNTVEQTK